LGSHVVAPKNRQLVRGKGLPPLHFPKRLRRWEKKREKPIKKGDAIALGANGEKIRGQMFSGKSIRNRKKRGNEFPTGDKSP